MIYTFAGAADISLLACGESETERLDAPAYRDAASAPAIPSEDDECDCEQCK